MRAASKGTQTAGKMAYNFAAKEVSGVVGDKDVHAAEGAIARRGVKNVCKVDAVILETLNGSIHSKYLVSANEALESGMKFL